MSTRVVLRSLLGVVTVLLCCLLSAVGSSADVQKPQYFGGPLLTAPRLVFVWAGGDTAQRQALEDYARVLTGPYLDGLKEMRIGHGAFAGSIDGPPCVCVTFASVQSYAALYLTPSQDTVYAVLLAQIPADCGCDGIHFPIGGIFVAALAVKDRIGAEKVLSHEFLEAITNPTGGGYGWRVGPGPYDLVELADACLSQTWSPEPAPLGGVYADYRVLDGSCWGMGR